MAGLHPPPTDHVLGGAEGIGAELVNRVMEQLRGLYAIDLCCDTDLFPYYERLGFQTFGGAGLRFPGAIRPAAEATPST